MSALLRGSQRGVEQAPMFANHWLDRSEPMESDLGHLPRNKGQDATNRCGVRDSKRKYKKTENKIRIS